MGLSMPPAQVAPAGQLRQVSAAVLVALLLLLLMLLEEEEEEEEEEGVPEAAYMPGGHTEENGAR